MSVAPPLGTERCEADPGLADAFDPSPAPISHSPGPVTNPYFSSANPVGAAPAAGPLSDDPVEAIVQLAILDADQREVARGPFYPLFDRNDSQLREGGSYPLSTYFENLPPHFQRLLAPLKSDPIVFFSPVLIPTDGGRNTPVVHVYSVAGTFFSDGGKAPPLSDGSLLLPPGGGYPIGVVMDPSVERVVFTSRTLDEETPRFAERTDQISDPFGVLSGKEAPLFPFIQDGITIPRSVSGTPQAVVEGFYRGASSVSQSRWGWAYGDEVRVDATSPIVDGTITDGTITDGTSEYPAAGGGGHWMAAGAIAVPGGRGALQALRTGGRYLWRGAARVLTSAPAVVLRRALTVDLLASGGSWAIKKVMWDGDPGSRLMLYTHNKMVDEDNVLGFVGSWAVELTWGVSMAASDRMGSVYANQLRWKSDSLVTENRWFVEGVEGFLKDAFERMIIDSGRESGRVDLVEVTTTKGSTVVFDVDADLDELGRRLFNFYNGKVDKGVNPGLIEQRYEELDYTGFRLPHGRLLKEIVDEKGLVTDHGKFRLYLSALFQEELDKAKGEQERQMIDLGLGEMKDGKFHSLLSTVIAEVQKGQRTLTEAQKDFLKREKAIGKDSLTWRVKFLEGITGKLNNF